MQTPSLESCTRNESASWTCAGRLGAEIVRWGPPDVLNGRRAIELATSVNRVLATAERTARFTGSAHSSPPMLRG